MAPRYYSSQRRAVTVRDYETLVAELYPNLQSLSVYGGEEANPPQYSHESQIAGTHSQKSLHQISPERKKDQKEREKII